jgi:hypothetical protein
VRAISHEPRNSLFPEEEAKGFGFRGKYSCDLRVLAGRQSSRVDAPRNSFFPEEETRRVFRLANDLSGNPEIDDFRPIS